MVLQTFNAASTSDREKKPLVESGFIHNEHLSLRSNGPVREDMTSVFNYICRKNDRSGECKYYKNKMT